MPERILERLSIFEVRKLNHILPQTRKPSTAVEDSEETILASQYLSVVVLTFQQMARGAALDHQIGVKL